MNRFFSMGLMVVYALTLSVSQMAFAHHISRPAFQVVPLVSSEEGEAQFHDSRLQNPIGLIRNNRGLLQVANNHHSQITLYKPSGKPVENFQIQTTPRITGLVHNTTDGFLFNKDHRLVKARLLIGTEEGKILAYSKKRGSPDEAQVVIDRSSFGSMYTGVEIVGPPIVEEPILYAADFYNGKVDMFSSEFEFLGSFTDPNLPEGFVPFNIKRIGPVLYVTFAKQSENGRKVQKGIGNGAVDVFGPKGTLIAPLIFGAPLDAPWGIELVPETFADFSILNDLRSALLVGNFGNGLIHAFNPLNGNFGGRLNHADGRPVEIPGLWSLLFQREKALPLNVDIPGSRSSFSSSSSSSSSESSYCECSCGSRLTPPFLYFTAGGDRNHAGLLGVILSNSRNEN